MSKQTIENKITYIQNNYTSFFENLIYPLICSLFYVIILPYLMWAIDILIKKSVTKRKDNKLNQQIIDITGKQTLTIEQGKLENINSELKNITELNKEIEKLNKFIKTQNNEIKIHKEEFSILTENYEELKSLLHKNKEKEKKLDPKFDKYKNEYIDFKQSDIYSYFKEVGSSIRNYKSFPKNLNEMIVEKYIIENIVVEERFDDEHNKYYKFTEKGNFFWKEYVMSLKINPKPLEPDDLPF